jgi:hypothetical protein
MSTFTHDGTENRMRWDRESRAFMEVWYATLNHSPTGNGIWLRYTITSPAKSEPYCELWGFLFDREQGARFAGKQRFPIDELGDPNGRDDGAIARIGSSWLSENHLEGDLVSQDRNLRWSLDFEPAERCFQHLPAALRGRVEKRVSTVCSPNLSVPFSGTVELDGEKFVFEKDLGCQSHRWGKSHSLSWAWSHCSVFDNDQDAVLEAVAARTSLGPVPAPTTTFIYLSFGGEDIAFNDLKWALRAKSHYEMPTWAFTARNERWKVVGAARARVDRMVQVTYTDPDGSNRYCANSEIADLALEVFARSNGGWRHEASLTATGKAHLEFGRKDPFAELPISL